MNFIFSKNFSNIFSKSFSNLFFKNFSNIFSKSFSKKNFEKIFLEKKFENKYFFLVSAILFFAGNFSFAQQDAQKLVTKNMHFKDGVYRSFQSWQKNQPDLKMSDISMSYFLNPITNILEIDSIAYRKMPGHIRADSAWSIVLSGVTYISVPKKDISLPLTTFAALTTTGNFCYFQYQYKQITKVPMTAYAPQTGEPFMTKEVTTSEILWRQKVMSFETGEIFDFNVSTVKTLVADDSGLIASLNALKPGEKVNKLFKCLMIYNDRHPVFLK